MIKCKLVFVGNGVEELNFFVDDVFYCINGVDIF